ncbi:MAG TPA: M48 family metallopeptidase [Syntrophorhabdales bacterium]|nr:M48 family metallopeptidase [Syntrophorhabdales bacterium]
MVRLVTLGREEMMLHIPGKKRFPLVAVCAILAVFGILVSCETVPLTGRQSLHLVSDTELVTLSLQQYQDVLHKSKLSQDQQKVQMVRNVGSRIAWATGDLLKQRGMGAEVSTYKWEFNLIEDDKTVNAWCMPGGKVAVYTGLLPVARDETGLAVVMGHEIAHAVAKHGNERVSEGLIQQMGGAALSVALSTQAAATKDLFLQAYNAGTNVAFMLPYSRLQESEADHIGLILMAKAGYDPRQAVPFWKRMAASGGSRPSEFLSTHPAPETRIKQIEALMPEAMSYYKR